jgi:nitrogen fixation/metabolism regulation signal transduction histidine kinase
MGYDKEVEERVKEQDANRAMTAAVTPARRWKQVAYENHIALLALAAALPGILAAIFLLFEGDYPPLVRWLLTVLIASICVSFILSLRQRIVRPLQTLSNLLAALREGDYSIRARNARASDALYEVMHEVNALGEILREQRLGALEATALLRAVMAEIDVAVFAFDGDERLRLVNRAGERLLAQPTPHLTGRQAAELGLAECLRGAEGDAPRTMQMIFPGGAGRWGVRRRIFREGGRQHQLLVLLDLSRVLREEELKAWQSLVRVLGHELRNSITPIKSIAESLDSILAREPRPADWHEDMVEGLNVISSRAASLSRFMESYASLARLPLPHPRPVDVGALIRRVVKLETRLPVQILPGREVTLRADSDQLEQILINLLRNAVDASLETGGGVEVGWSKTTAHLEVWIKDEGYGLANSSNLFVPFFTTKKGGTGIGLVLSRQIAEAHNGMLTLENRTERSGCIARLRLPL